MPWLPAAHTSQGQHNSRLCLSRSASLHRLTPRMKCLSPATFLAIKPPPVACWLKSTVANGLTVPMRRGRGTTIRLQESGISGKITGVTLNNCPSCTSNIRRSGDTARIDLAISASTPVGIGPSVTLKITGRPDPVLTLAINPGYSIITSAEKFCTRLAQVTVALRGLRDAHSVPKPFPSYDSILRMAFNSEYKGTERCACAEGGTWRSRHCHRPRREAPERSAGALVEFAGVDETLAG